MSDVTYDALKKRIAELEAALEKQEAIKKDDAKWMMAYHQWCVMNGCPPSSSNLIAALDALVDTRHMGEKTYWYLKPDGPEAADRIAKLETHLEERKMSSGLVWCICSEADDRIKELNARIAELETALATARRDGMEEAAKIAADYETVAYQHGNLPISDPNECAAQAAREIATSIRAALGEEK